MGDFPEKNKKRAERRHLKQRMKEKAHRIAKYIWHLPEEWCIKNEKLADHLQFCNCRACANNRKTEGPSISEMRNRAKGTDEDINI